MRFIVSPEQLKFFQLQGYLEIEEILTAQEAKLLLDAIQQVRANSPGCLEENLFRSTPLIATLLKKKGWGHIAASLIHRRPLSLVYDKFSTSLQESVTQVDVKECGLLIELISRRGFFFKNLLLSKNLYNSAENCYFVLIMRAGYLPDQSYPLAVN